MSDARRLARLERWLRLLLRLYPPDFREEMGEAMVETYRDRGRDTLRRGGGLAGTGARALYDALRNGLGERLRPTVSWRRQGNWGRDMELATRRLRRAPVFAVAMIGTLTVGLGAFAVVYTAVHKILLAPLPYERPEDLYYVWRDYTAYFDLDRGWLGGTDVAALQEAGGVIEDAAALLRSNTTLSGGEGLDPIEIRVLVTSPNLFELLGVRPALGRGFRADEAGPGRPGLLVLTHALWNRLGSDPAVVGSELRLNGQPYTVIGVMARDFSFVRNASLGPPQSADAYTTLPLKLAETNPGSGSYAGLIRVQPGTSVEQVKSAVAAVGRMIDERDFQGRGLKLWPVGMKDDLVAGVRPALVVLGFAGVFLVIMLMLNLATLLLARAAQREQEFAVSRALGANPIALVRATLLEGGLLGLLGGAAAALAAVWGTKLVVALAPIDLPRREAVAMDWAIAAIIVAVGVLLGLLAAIIPSVWAARTSLGALLSNTAVRGGGGHGRMRRAMVVVQVALSVVLLSVGGLVVRSFERLLRADPGFDPRGLVTMRVPLPSQVFPDSAATAALQDRVHAALAAIPGVSGVTATTALPLSASASQTTITIPGAPGNTGDRDHDTPLVDYIGTRAGYVEVMRMRLLEGRTFERSRRPGVYEAMIDDVLARYFFPTGNPLGAKIPFGGTDSLTIVGVVKQARLYDVHQDDRPQLYLPAEDAGYRTLIFVLRSDRDPASIVADARRALSAVDPQLALGEVRTMDDIVRDSLRQEHVSAVLIAGFSLGALLLAGMGLFGVVSAAVTRRRHELAVRLALGADYGGVLRLVMREGARLIALGLIVGVPATYAAGRAIAALFVGVSPTDPLTLAAVGAALGLVALVSCYVPARRVLGIEPARSLRQS